MNGTIKKEEIKRMIVEIRRVKVMLAFDLAKIFGCKNGTKEINQTLKRNIDKFSLNSYFQINNEEYYLVCSRCQNSSSRSQSVTLNNKKNNRGTNLKYLPYVFTKEGIYTLSTILKSESSREIARLIISIFDEESQYQIIEKCPEIQAENVRTMIYELNGTPIMLDYDLAKIYRCKNGAKTINQAVKRNIERFPNDFYFQLEDSQYDFLRSQIGTANLTKSRTLPYVFTEQGVYMLATVLRTENAIKVNIALIRAFTLMRHYLEENKNLILSINNINNKLNYYDSKFIEQDKKIEELFNGFKSKEKKELIFMNGEVYDSYSKIIDILSIAKKNIIIIDGYADKSVLDMISKLKVKVTLIVKEKGMLNTLDTLKYNKQYNNLTIIYNNDFHDRFIIIDKSTIYHLGSSINHAGSKVFAINRLEEKVVINVLINKINNLLKINLSNFKNNKE